MRREPVWLSARRCAVVHSGALRRTDLQVHSCKVDVVVQAHVDESEDDESQCAPAAAMPAEKEYTTPLRLCMNALGVHAQGLWCIGWTALVHLCWAPWLRTWLEPAQMCSPTAWG